MEYSLLFSLYLLVRQDVVFSICFITFDDYPQCRINSLLGHEVGMLSIGFIAVPHFQVMNFAAMSAFEVANLTAKDKFYDLQIISEAGGRVKSSVGISVETLPFGKKVYDTVIVSGSPHISPPSA